MSTPKLKVKNLADFRAAHDKNVIVPTKIKNALVEMEAEGGAENWDYEPDFIKRAGISITDVNQFRDQFSSHIAEAKSGSKSVKRAWFVSPKIAAKARGE